jgi:hypothetical protein
MGSRYMKDTQIVKINKETLVTLRSEYPNCSVNEIMGWILLELDKRDKECKEHNISPELYSRACNFFYYLASKCEGKIMSWRDVCMLENVDYKNARLVLED